jgi:hypothetical protein
MQQLQTLVLFGDSLVIDVVEACLNSNPNYETRRIFATDTHIPHQLNKLKPGLIIFDVDTGNLQPILRYLQSHQQIPLLGLSADSNDAVVLCSQAFKIPDSRQLAQIVYRMLADTDPPFRAVASRPGQKTENKTLNDV